MSICGGNTREDDENRFMFYSSFVTAIICYISLYTYSFIIINEAPGSAILGILIGTIILCISVIPSVYVYNDIVYMIIKRSKRLEKIKRKRRTIKENHEKLLRFVKEKHIVSLIYEYASHNNDSIITI